jgi:hypothetical protein
VRPRPTAEGNVCIQDGAIKGSVEKTMQDEQNYCALHQIFLENYTRRVRWDEAMWYMRQEIH